MVFMSRVRGNGNSENQYKIHIDRSAGSILVEEYPEFAVPGEFVHIKNISFGGGTFTIKADSGDKVPYNFEEQRTRAVESKNLYFVMPNQNVTMMMS